MELISFIKVVILGMFEGLTEFAPVSSTGHMIIVDDMWLHSHEFLGPSVANTFKVVVQLGSILAVVVVFKDRFVQLLGLDTNGNGDKLKARGLKLSHILVGLIPAAALGFLVEDYIDQYLFTIETVMVGLLLGSFLMIIADKSSNSLNRTRTVDQMTYRQALVIGTIQCFSLWPGFSRSGATISAGVLVGMSHRAAADFTFIMAVPIMLGASTLSFIKNIEYFTLSSFPLFLSGFISAFLFAFISIKFFLRLINKIKLFPFAIYRIVLVGVLFIFYTN
ncbi:undecaprenyl-diphosphate phosphatase [Halobacillus yeomjeoni]|uniref:Undecaprenyl-diphosphatase n=1 Tax=Halobacillus yeomjeoni TaxID=311194 RepID=A0A931MUU6_9BACI|nr:undecaprenyl-diphosphate phosphatase [Halobacillus yeomjeoni]MBH0229696.1 undecaprenyl-diphosphate phosphatase [Halobacillus yeomjeoni]